MLLLPIPQRAGLLSLFRPTQLLSRTSPFNLLHLHTTEPNQDFCNSYIRLLQCHPGTRSIEQVHARILVEGSSLNSFSATHLVKSYAKAGNLQAARLVFDTVQKKRIFLWNAMIRAYSLNELWLEITQLYRRMEEERVEPDNYTLPFVIKAFSALSSVKEGKRIHDFANQMGLVSNVYVATALMGMYLKFGEIDLAHDIFDGMPERDVVAWTSMISGCVDSGNHRKALRVFRDMRLGDEKPNWVTVLSLIPACDSWVHGLILKSGLDFYAEVETAILDMYAKSGDMVTARSLFDWMSERSLVSWTVMVGGYSQNGYAHEALIVFYQMLKTANLKPDSIIAASVLQACAQLGSLNCGEMIHGYIVQAGGASEVLVRTALVDMYAKCGSINTAEKTFHEIQDRNMITWSALIAGYGYHGLGLNALNIFEKMKREGFVPDETAFLSVLSACNHSGLVLEGKECFNSMVRTHKLVPGTKHYACMVDLLGRAGLVEEAWNLIEEMQVEPEINVWGALLSACRAKGDVKVAEFAFKRLFELGPDNTEYHVLLANVYAGCGRWDEVSKVRSVLRRNGERKTPGCSFIEVNCKTTAFFAGDGSHPESKNIYSMLEMLHAFASDTAVDI
ncbi:hypothetical protein HHK36_009716 [Tetracentron sinense]|uniref:Uncharacterized protein n=1 Tax=Tetracentron sinense TaxID=13715 RepID=A0A834ZLX5_TETSI|nr:hypothetical protein HHK36_009716 [Tetracentron sinense]